MSLRPLRTDWRWAHFDEVARVASDLIDPAAHPDLPHVAPNHIESRTGRLLPVRTIADDGVTSAKHHFSAGQILYSKIRPYLAKATIASFEGLCSADMYPIETTLNTRYLLYWLLSPEFTELASRVQGRTVLPKINRDQLGQLPVPVPPGPEQARIVAAIDEEFSRLEAGAAALGRAHERAGRSLEIVLRAGCAGNLLDAADMADHKTIDDLLAKLPAMKATKGRDATTDIIIGRCILSVGMPKNPAPKGWRWIALADIAQMESGHTPSRRQRSYWNGPYPWIGIQDARDSHGGVIRRTHQTITDDGLAHSSARLLPPGTVCLSRTASVGYVVVMGRSMATSQDFVNWVCSEALVPDFLKYALLAEGGDIRRFGRGSVHTTIYYPEAKALHICLPPPATQRRIVDRLDELVGAHHEMLRVTERQRQRVVSLRNSILAAAFAGRLASGSPSARVT